MKFDLGHINKLVAVSVKMESDGYTFHYHILKLKKGEIFPIKSEKLVPDIRTLIKKISKKIPVVLHIHGKGILNRKVNYQENYRHALLMNARLEDFYFTDYIDNETVYSSVIRKDTVREVLELFKDQNVEVVSFGTGPFVAVPLFEFTGKDAITVDSTLIQQEDGRIISFDRSDEYRTATFIGEDQFSHDTVGAIALAVNHFYPSESIVLPEEPDVYEINFKEAKQKNVFYRFAYGMVIFFLLLLCANYIYLDHLNSKIEENYQVLAEFEDQLAELNTLSDEKGRKEKLLEGSGLLNRYFLSYYLMEISNSVPGDVTLDQVSLRPLVDEIKSRHKIEFNERLVVLTGKSKSANILDHWINDLKEKEWLATVDILDYTYKKNIGNFELEIVLR
ncbi:MAG: hypothetical protein HUJ25_17855 [Crocinitomicaceae bacterium]|nr:hypothetical protein [Crocinitomicaceae bacterium]